MRPRSVRTHSYCPRLAFVFASLSLLPAQAPVVWDGGVVNAASFVRHLPTTPGSLVSVFGANLSSATVWASSIPLPFSLGGVTVTFNGARAALLYVSPTQINAQLPWEVSPGSATVVVTRDGISSAAKTLLIDRFSPGVFGVKTFAIAINQDGSLAAPLEAIPGMATRPANHGDAISILATGLGAVDSPVATGSNSMDRLRSTVTTPTVYVGGKPAQILFHGLSPEFVGVNQINIKIPEGVVSGPTAPLQIELGGVRSMTRAIAVGGSVEVPVPPEFQDLYAQLEAALLDFHKAIDSQWNGAKKQMRFSGELLPADNIEFLPRPGYYEASIIPYLDLLELLGIKAVKVQMGFPILYQPFYANFLGNPGLYDQYLSLYKRLVQDVHARGMAYIAQCQEVHAERGGFLNIKNYYGSLTFEQYKDARAAFVVNVARQLNPDYLLLQTEPDTEATNSGRPELLDPDLDAGMIREMLGALAAANAHTMIVGSGMGTWLTEYRRLAALLAETPDLDLMDIHVYPINNNLFGGSSQWRRALEIADVARAAGKRVGVSESWLYKSRDSELVFGALTPEDYYARDTFSFWEPLDRQFLDAMVKFGYFKQLDYLNATWSMYFFAYLDYERAMSACGFSCTSRRLLDMLNQQAAAAIEKLETTSTGLFYSNRMQR